MRYSSKQVKIFKTFVDVYNSKLPVVEKLILLDSLMPGIEKLVRQSAIAEIEKSSGRDPEVILDSILKAQLSGYINKGVKTVLN
jgi:hypothetical protein